VLPGNDLYYYVDEAVKMIQSLPKDEDPLEHESKLDVES